MYDDDYFDDDDNDEDDEDAGDFCDDGCYECSGYGDDYAIKDGELVNLCSQCPKKR